ncbi:MAG TPA: chemotaxis protein CheW [Nodosilinea sp.]|nr:chemotaxis protein CheW [Nodosilinea sp.]
MNTDAYLLFTLDDTPYGLAAEGVQEIFLLPALTAVLESGPEVAGILNLRGQWVPVLNLGLCLGHPQRPNFLEQVVIVIQADDRTVGLVVDSIQTVETIAVNNRSMALETPYLSSAELAITAGLASHGDAIVTLLNPTALVRGGQSVAVAAGGSNRFMVQFGPDDQQVLLQRAANLTQQTADDGFAGLSALAVVGLEGERFALGLETVHEFAEVPQVTPIPCCPAHIVGNMNLRGEILTLVDVRRFLNLHPATTAKPRKAVVMRLGSLVAGVVVDEVFDVVYLKASEMAAIPTAIHSSDNEYLRGIAHYGDAMVGLLDLPKLLTQGDLVVDQSS